MNNSLLINRILYLKIFNSKVRWLMVTTLGLILLILSAKIKVPIPPVPITLQTLVVLVYAMCVGSRISSVTFILYLFLGSMSLPVFANPPYGGLGYMLGPSGGYLLGMLLCSYVVGFLAENNFDKSFFKSFLAMSIGTILIFLPGVLWLGYWYNFSSINAQELNFTQSYYKALQNGLLLFKFTEPVKLLLASFIVPLFWQFKK